MKLLLFGATGNLGKEIAKEAVRQGYDITVVVRNRAKVDQFKGITSKHVIVDVIDPMALTNICNDFEVVISALGKSVSLNDKSRFTFMDIDFNANSTILSQAVKSRVKKFVYVSALHSEKYLHLEYFKAHHEFSEKLKSSGINYSIIKPPAIFSAFVDLITMAQKGQLMNIGKGDKRTNPIFEGDLAKICMDSIKENNSIIEAGGKQIFTRKELNELIQQEVDPTKRIRTVPLGMFKLSLPLIKLFNKNMYDKFAFYTEVIRYDTLARAVGETQLKGYIRKKINFGKV